MLWIDYALLALIAGSVVLGFVRGFVREVLALMVWVAACGFAGYGYALLSPYLYFVPQPVIRQGIARIVLLVGTLAVGGVVTALLGKLLSSLGLSTTDRLLGALFGALRGLLVICTLLFFWDYFLAGSHHPVWRQSQLVPHGACLLQWILALFKNSARVI
jgi:membrane protein required for colicin V production